MRLSKLTTKGIEEFIYFLDNINNINVKDHRIEILGHSNAVGTIACISPENLPPLKIDVARYLFELLENVSHSMQFDKGLWCWLSLYYFDSVCLKDKNGEYKVGDINRWVPIFDHHQKYHRHLLANPWVVYKRYEGDRSALSAVLAGSVKVHGELLEQFSSRQELISCKPIMQAVTRLYFNEKTQLPKRGSSSSGPGSPRRFALVHQQLSRTYDFYEMNVDDILNLLPKEFNKFIKE